MQKHLSLRFVTALLRRLHRGRCPYQLQPAPWSLYTRAKLCRKRSCRLLRRQQVKALRRELRVPTLDLLPLVDSRAPREPLVPQDREALAGRCPLL